MSFIHKLSKIFQPFTASQKNIMLQNVDIISNSQRLLVELGVIRQASPGLFSVLPLGLRSLEKVCKIIDKEMQSIDAQKLYFPTLTSADLWKATKRYDDNESELFILQDRHRKHYILSPTYEEAAADLLTSVSLMSYKQFPLRLYQISSKFRDEIKPRFGIMRGREFIMKDLYSYDTSVENAKETYRIVCESYDKIFKTIGVNYVQVQGSSGTMGGTLSHEYHFPAPIGEDKILTCKSCNYSANLELLQQKETCPKCNSSEDNITITNGIEVGHTFFLGDRYSKPLNAVYMAENAKPEVIQMGSYGLGISRILAASVEVLCSAEEIRWPLNIAPYKAVLITPKDGSKEQKSLLHSPEEIYEKLSALPLLDNDVVLDDRNTFTIGKRIIEAKRMGYPYIIVIGKKASQSPPIYEVMDLNNKAQYDLTMEQMLDMFGRLWQSGEDVSISDNQKLVAKV